MMDVGHLFSSIIGYFLMLPSYINIMLPFALANINDISWGMRSLIPNLLLLTRYTPTRARDWAHPSKEQDRKRAGHDI